MTKEKNKTLFFVTLAIALIILAVNSFYLFSEDYVTIYDNGFMSDGVSEILTVKYSELSNAGDGISRKLTEYFLGQPYGEDTRTLENLSYVSIVIGMICTAIGVCLFIKQKDTVLLALGSIICCVGPILLYVLIQSVEKELADSLLGNLGMLFGASILFESTVQTYLILSVILCAAMVVFSYLYKRDTLTPQSQCVAENTANIETIVEADNQKNEAIEHQKHSNEKENQTNEPKTESEEKINV